VGAVSDRSCAGLALARAGYIDPRALRWVFPGPRGSVVVGVSGGPLCTLQRMLPTGGRPLRCCGERSRRGREAAAVNYVAGLGRKTEVTLPYHDEWTVTDVAWRRCHRCPPTWQASPQPPSSRPAMLELEERDRVDVPARSRRFRAERVSPPRGRFSY